MMKKIALTLVTFVMVLFTQVTATNTNSALSNGYGNSFTFSENGITFAIFQNGEFDFYLNNYARSTATIQINNVNISFNAGYNYNAYVQYDRFGAVIQIMNTPIYYDYYGRVTQIGNVDIQYNQNRLIRLGNMRVYYNNYGQYAYYSGYINNYNRYYTYNSYHNCFVQPYYDYRVVSSTPYRTHYKAQRYAYGYEKSNHQQYNNKQKGTNYYKQTERVKTNNIPNKRNETVVVNNRKRMDSPTNERNVGSTHKRSTAESTRVNHTRSNAEQLRKPVKPATKNSTAAISSRELAKKEVGGTTEGKRSY
jgi:hypothetical protein